MRVTGELNCPQVTSKGSLQIVIHQSNVPEHQIRVREAHVILDQGFDMLAIGRFGCRFRACGIFNTEEVCRRQISGESILGLPLDHPQVIVTESHMAAGPDRQCPCNPPGRIVKAFPLLVQNAQVGCSSIASGMQLFITLEFGLCFFVPAEFR